MIVPSASLVPENNPTVLFTTAGMFPLIPFFLGEKHPNGTRLTDAQKCIRTDDIDEVGDKVHHTFFEMLGNWSFGDYFKEEAIEWSFEFLTGQDWLNIPVEKLAFSVFAGDEDASFDQESYDKWLSLGISPKRIAKLPKKNNWWGPGEVGPCGPDTEMFYWSGQDEAPVKFDPEDSRWVEVWNDVFMQFNRTQAGELEVLKQKNVDTGMGFERALAVLSGSDDNYTTDLFWPIIQEIEKLSKLEYGDKTDEEYIKDGKQCWVDVRIKFRIIADHLRAAVFAISDGVVPSNKERGYIVRRLIRRAIVKGQQLDIKDSFTATIAKRVFEIYSGVYEFDKDHILAELEKEENKFRRTINEGLKQFEKTAGIGSMPAGTFVAGMEFNTITGQDLFDLYQTYGFPLELSLELVKEKSIPLEADALGKYEIFYKKHQDTSRTASAGMFKGGLADAGIPCRGVPHKQQHRAVVSA